MAISREILMTEQTKELKVYFQSVGVLRGQYLPSEADITIGTLITTRGIFPANLMPSLGKFIEESPSATTERLRYICWLQGVDTKPYYMLKLKRVNKFGPSWLRRSGRFRVQGLVEKVNQKEVTVFVRRNYRSSPNEEQMKNSPTHIRISLKDCPADMRRGEFWRFDATLEEGHLNCFRTNFLADAKEAKRILEEEKELFLQRKQRDKLRLI